MSHQTQKFLPQLRDALDRYTTDENWATWGALCTACAAIAGEEWAVEQLQTNAAWDMDSAFQRRVRAFDSEFVPSCDTEGL